MAARILVLDNYRERKAVCLMCHHTWFMAEPEPSDQMLDCPRCHNDTGLYASACEDLDV